MNSQALVLLGQLIVAVVSGGVLVAIINNFLSPKTKAETKSIAQKTAQETIDQALATLRADLLDARAQIDRAVTRADKAEHKADDAETKLDAVAARDRELVDYLWRLMTWTKRWYEQGHPPNMVPPPEPPAAIDELLKS